MADLPTAGAKLELDLSAWDANWASALDTAESVMTEIPTEAEVDVSFTTSGDDVLADIEEIPDSTETEVSVTEDAETKSLLDGLNFIIMKEKFELAMDIVGNVWDFFTSIQGITLDPFLDVEEVVAKINARTGGTGIADLGQLIRDIQFADLGESADQIGDVLIQAQQLNLPLKQSAEAALTFTHTWTEIDPTTVVGAWGTALETGIVDNMQEASDLMTVFFQQGGNIGGDAIQVVQANAQSWADMGLNLAQALSIMNSLQQGTGATATDAQKMMQTFDDALTTAANDPASQQAKLLRLMGIDNPKDQGKAIGAETFDGFAEAFSAASSDQQDLISGLFFGKAGKKFTGAIGEMTSQGNMFADVVGAAEEAAAAADDSLRGVIDDFVLGINEAISNLLSSAAIDIPGKIEDIKKALQGGLDTLGNGGTIGDALEVILDAPGLSETLDTALTNIERVFGQLVLTLLEIVASLQDPLGVNDNDKGTRMELARLAGQQLPFDIKVANADELDAIFEQAGRRGVSAIDMGAALSTAMEELVAAGDFTKVQALMGQVLGNPAITPEAKQAFADKWNGLIEEAKAKLNPIELGPELAPKNPLGAFGAEQGAGTGKSIEAIMSAFGGKGGGVGGLFGPAAQAFADLQTNAEAAMSGTATAVTDASATMQTDMAATGDSAELLDGVISRTMTDNTVTASFDAVAAAANAAFPSVMKWFAQTSQAAAVFDASVSVHFRNVVKQLNDINFLAQQTISNVTQAAGLGGGGGSVTNNNINVSVSNNVNTQAAAAANGYALGRSIRGMA